MKSVYRLGRTPLDFPLSLFLLSAWLSIGVSYDPRLSWRMLASLTIGVLLFYLVVVLGRAGLRSVMAAGLVMAGAGLSLYICLQYRHLDFLTKVGAVSRLGELLSGPFPPWGDWHPFSNSVATFLEGIMPVGVALAVSARRGWSRVLHGSLVSLMALALLLTVSRGAWVALGVCLGLGMVLRVRRGRRWLVALALLGVAAFVALSLLGGDWNLQGVPLVGKLLAWLFYRPDRVEIYRGSWYLIRDFPFTGIGLGETFSMMYSRYVLLIQVPFLNYSHHLFLEIWLEQGLLGLLAFLGLIGAFYSFVVQAPRRDALFTGAWLGVTAILLHGLSDARQYVDGWTFLPLFVLLGLAVGGGVGRLEGWRGERLGGWKVGRLGGWKAVGLVCVGVLIVLGLVWRPVVGMAYANAGAVVQARGELAPGLEDAERAELLRRASGYYQRALDFTTDNSTAWQRLGRLAMDAGRYEEAVRYLEIAWQAEPGNPATRKALGLAYVWVGRFDEAEPLLRGVKDIVQELNVWAGWRRGRGEVELAANAYRMSLRLKPNQPKVQQALLALEQ